jgi:hypothetical protein
VLTAHLYGASKCSATAPTVTALLGPAVRTAESVALRQLETVAAGYRLGVWLDETNNISCGGEPGVSNAYGAALWAVDLLARVLKPPFVGAAFHGFLNRAGGYTPIAVRHRTGLASGRLSAQPEWYALLLAHRVVGDRPLQVRLSARAPALTVWAGLTRRGTTQIIAVDEQPRGSRPLELTVLGRTGSVLRLTGPALTATSGVTLGGASVTASGSWQSRQTEVRTRRTDDLVQFAVQAGSAVLAEVSN